MKRIKSINGYTIYQATTQRDADNYNCEIGSYNIYLSSDIRDFGLTNSYPEYDNIDSLTAALNICCDSRFAIACALADELSDSTIQDMDLCLEIERRFDAGESVEYVRDCYDPETGILHAEPSENPSYYTWLDSVRDQYIADCHAEDDDDLSDDELDGDLEDVLEEALSAGDRADQNLDYDYDIIPEEPLKLEQVPGNTDDYIMLGCNDSRLFDYEYANFDGDNYYWVNIDLDDYQNQIDDLTMWAADRLNADVVIN